MRATGHAVGLEVVDDRADSTHGGHTLVLTRARVGQGKFRKDVLKRYGAECAVTGPAPEMVLDAAHLYSYATVGNHLDQGGILLRKDIHRLFDAGALAIDPSNMTIDLIDDLKTCPGYSPLQGAGLRISPTNKQAGWIADHWGQHRGT
jgi:hypothetical protein